MSTRSLARTWLASVISNHVGKNIRQYRSSTYVGELAHNTLGGAIYLSPCEGKVAEVTEDFTLIKTAAAQFCVVSTGLLDTPVSVGDKIGLSFYQLRRFDGTLADGSEDPSEGFCRTIMLTGAATYFPVKWEGRYLAINDKFADGYTEIQNPYLREMINQMEKLPVSDGLRRVVNVLTDANPSNLRFIDPAYEDSATIAPAIELEVATGKHTGTVKIQYNRVPDSYTITLTGTTNEVIEDIFFDDLGNILVDAIDDGTWIKAKVTMIKAAPKKREAKAAA